MKIKHLEIQNFRKLKSCRIDVSKKETVLVGANNSGKTSAMDALIYFLQKKGELKTTYFTLSNLVDISNIGEKWLAATEENPIELSLDEWIEYLPTLDLWLDVNDNEVHYVSHLIPSLDWKGGLIGVRFIYFPKDLELLYKNFKEQYLKATFDVWDSGLLELEDCLPIRRHA